MTRKKRSPVAFDAADLARDAELLRLVQLAPEDAATVLVYTDWLEEKGDLPRAEFLRLQAQLRGMKVSHPRLLARGKDLHALGKKLPAAWVEAVSHPQLAGTAWDGKDDDGFLIWRFLPTGLVNYSQPSGTYENGRWKQIGITVAMDTNAHYADYFGVIVGNVMRGNAQNIVGRTWRWKVTWSNEPAVATIPEAVNRTVHDDHVRTRRAAAAAKRKRTLKAKAKAALARPVARPRKARPKPPATPARKPQFSRRSR